MKAYEVILSRYSDTGKIRELIIERKTESSIWVDGRRRAKSSSYENYYDTWEEAKAALMQDAENKMAHARANLERQKDYLGNVKGLKQ